jgi:hypothetical protein
MMKVVLWFLTVFGGIAIMMWLVPPREIERRLRLETEKPTFQRQKLNEALPRYDGVICPTAPPCWKDGKPIVGAL